MDKLITAKLGTQVKIRGTEKTAILVAILHNLDGMQYQITFWDELVRRVEWVFACEIQMINSENNCNG